MDKVAENIYNLCVEVQPYTYVLAIVSALVIGAMFLIPSDKSREKAKAATPFVIIGVIVMLGAVYLGKWICEKIVF